MAMHMHYICNYCPAKALAIRYVVLRSTKPLIVMQVQGKAKHNNTVILLLFKVLTVQLFQLLDCVLLQSQQFTRSRPEVHTFAWKKVRCITHMGVNNMHDLKP